MMKNASEPIGIRTRDLVACSAVPQPTVQLCTPSCVDSRGVYLLPVFYAVYNGESYSKSFHT